MNLQQPTTSIGLVLMTLVTINFIMYGVECIPMELTSYLRFVRNTGGGVMPMPPPVCPPPPNVTVATPQSCNLNCGTLKELKTNPCRCECSMIIPAECPTPIPRDGTTRKSKGKKKRKGKRSHSRNPQTSSDGCPELTPKGRRYKKQRGRRSHSGKSKSKKSGSKGGQSTQVAPAMNGCPMGQQLNTTSCQCMIVMSG